MSRSKAIEILQKAKEGELIDPAIINIALFITGDSDEILELGITRKPIYPSNCSIKLPNHRRIMNTDLSKSLIEINAPVAYVSGIFANRTVVISMDKNKPLKTGMLLYPQQVTSDEVRLHKKIARLQSEVMGLEQEVDRLRQLLADAYADDSRIVRSTHA